MLFRSLEMSYIEERSDAEIAGLLRINESAARTRVYRALKAAQKVLSTLE